MTSVKLSSDILSSLVSSSSSSSSSSLPFPSSTLSSTLSSTKNSTRLASILGTWTGQTHLKTDVGSYELLAYFVVHFMSDPMRGYGCSLDGCNEEQNQVCQNKGAQEVCTDIANGVVDWSDVDAFIYFGARIDAGFPFNKHRAEDTGGWVGPLNIIMASGDIPNPKSGETTEIVDRYVSRYVTSPLTEYLQMPSNCTLLSEDDFNKVAGPIAVNSTSEKQYDPDANVNDPNYDPYHEYYKTCDNGDVKPLLPLFEFDFEQDTETKEESIQVKLNYKFLTMPDKNDFMYDLYPMVQKRFNKADLGFHISGPYCYGNNPKRGYTFDMNFDTRGPKAMLTLTHGCVEGLPCTPPAEDLYNAKAGSNIHVVPNVSPSGDGAIVNVGSSIGFILTILIMFILLLLSTCYNWKLRKQLKRYDEMNDNDGGEVLIAHDVISQVESNFQDDNNQEQSIEPSYQRLGGDDNISISSNEYVADKSQCNEDSENNNDGEDIIVDGTTSGISTTPLIES